MIVLMVFRVIFVGDLHRADAAGDVETIPRVVLGFALIVVTGLPIIFLFFLTVWDLISPFIRRRQWSATRVGDAELNEKSSYAFARWAPGGHSCQGRSRSVRGGEHAQQRIRVRDQLVRACGCKQTDAGATELALARRAPGQV